MWYLPGPGLEPVSPALAGRFLTTVPPGKPRIFLFKTNKQTNISSSLHCMLHLMVTCWNSHQSPMSFSLGFCPSSLLFQVSFRLLDLFCPMPMTLQGLNVPRSSNNTVRMTIETVISNDNCSVHTLSLHH